MVKVKELIRKLKELNQDGYIVVSSDEEMNTLFNDFEINEIEPLNEKEVYVIFGLSGSENDELR